MRQSRIKRLIPKRLARRLAQLEGAENAELARSAEREAAQVMAKMQAKGYRLVSRLETGEGVFVRDDDLVGLHIQIPTSLYQKLERECDASETTKRSLVIAALERYLGAEDLPT